jgi:hypothetical protein
MQKSNTSESRPGLTYLIVDKLLIVLIVAAASLYFKFTYESAIGDMTVKNNQRLDSIYTQSKIHIDSMSKVNERIKDSSLQFTRP